MAFPPSATSGISRGGYVWDVMHPSAQASGPAAPVLGRTAACMRGRGVDAGVDEPPQCGVAESGTSTLLTAAARRILMAGCQEHQRNVSVQVQ
jgi:hypothetical protein